MGADTRNIFIGHFKNRARPAPDRFKAVGNVLPTSKNEGAHAVLVTRVKKSEVAHNAKTLEGALPRSNNVLVPANDVKEEPHAHVLHTTKRESVGNIWIAFVFVK